MYYLEVGGNQLFEGTKSECIDEMYYYAGWDLYNPEDLEIWGEGEFIYMTPTMEVVYG